MIDLNSLASLLQARVLPPSDLGSNIQLVLRWIHFLAGITWIGLLYFFNMVSIPGLKTLDSSTRSKVVTTLLPRALWWFRWGAVVTVLAGFVYWVLILRTEPPTDPGSQLARTLGIWFGLVILTWLIQYFLLLAPPLVQRVWLYVILVLAVVGAMGHFMAQSEFFVYSGMSNRALSIAVGGGIGFIMLLNVWGIVWRIQKRLIAWTREAAEQGGSLPPQAELMAQQALAASRANAWLSIPMLFFMAAASHYPLFGS